MRRRAAVASFVANPVLVGAVTVLVVLVAVFLAYNANRGLPFVPTTQLKVRVPNAAKLVVGNDVREGGYRVGILDGVRPVRNRDGTAGAELTLKLDEGVGPVPADTTVAILPRSALGLKYVDLQRGESDETLPDGATITAGGAATPPELEQLFEIFDERTRRDVRRNLLEFGNGFAARGDSLNRTLGALPELLRDLEPVMRVLAQPETELARFFRAQERAARATAPVAEAFARGFRSQAQTFAALTRHPREFQALIERSPATMDAGLRSFPVQRPFLRRLADVSPDLADAARALGTELPPLNAALRVGVDVLPRTPALNEDLRASFVALRDLAREPGTNRGLRGLTALVGTLSPTLRYLGPHITVCNYWNYWWTYLADHLTDQDASGNIQRVAEKTSPNQESRLDRFGAVEPAHSENYNRVASGSNDPADLHAQYYGRAVDEQGNADCESGQRGYPRRLAEGAPPGYNIAVDPRTPGNQGPTFKGRPRVPRGQTFSAEPTLTEVGE